MLEIKNLWYGVQFCGMMYIEDTCQELQFCNKIESVVQKIDVNALLDTEKVEILRKVKQ